MDLSLDQTEGYLLVRRVDAHSVTLLDRVVEHSFLLTPAGVTEAWPVAAAGSLGVDDCQALLALKPEVVILGTGDHQVFPAAAFMAGFLRKGIGIEVMDNAAAARTYNLLAGEDRHVVAGFILPPG
ncbi:Mth938-like domain-containing protein [Rhodanobacter lindaniclasticus]